jgi:hypothetical protein
MNKKWSSKNNFNFLLKSPELFNYSILVGILLHNVIPIFITLLLKSGVL